MAVGHCAATRSVLDGHEHVGALKQIETDRTEMDANTVVAWGWGVTPIGAKIVLDPARSGLILGADARRVRRPGRAKTYGKKREHGPNSCVFLPERLNALLRRYEDALYCVQ
jgi:hypothetical protein